MSIQPGSRLGPYEVTASIGAGGMGEVWRAKDTRLDRQVAIKVLPRELAGNAQFLLRFDREARAISQLNHPHVCTLFDVGEAKVSGSSLVEPTSASVHYIVMELIEGESLADRVRKGPLPLTDVLKYGRQIALALDAAHRRGITHRDLKPGNIMLTKSGAKLLDFGLAKTAAEGGGVIDGGTNLLTAARPLTQEGTILGTFQYMAPEQLEGTEADARTDIFALGAVLYEMATGRRAFEGNSKTSLIAAIVTSQPQPIASVVAMSPPALDHIVRRCLEKDPGDRWQSAHDVASELQWISEAGSQAGVAVPVSRKKRRLASIGWIAAAAIAGAWAVASLTMKPPPQPRIETSIEMPDGVFLDSSGGGIALSPDGSRIAFVAHRLNEKKLLWVRDLGSSAVRPIAGTEDASLPFWSPNGNTIAFVTFDTLKRVPLEGGSPEIVAKGNISGGTWTPGGDIVYSSDAGIFRVPGSGGNATKVLDLPGRSLRNPRILPDGNRFLFTSVRGGRDPDAVYAAALDGAPAKVVVQGIYSNTSFVNSGMILHVRDGDLRGQPVDRKTLAVRGDATRIVDRVQYDPDSQNALFATSDNGTLAYVTGEGAGKTELVWVDRSGKDLQTLGPPAMYYTPRLSHDEKRIAVDESEPQTARGDIWILDLQRGASTRLTWDPANESSPLWTSDDGTVIYFSEKKGHLDLYERSSGGVGTDRLIFGNDASKVPLDLSPDGRWLAFQKTVAQSFENPDVWLFDRSSGKAAPFLASPFAESALQFSPDGKWITYQTNESGQTEVYVRAFPESKDQWIVSRGGGEQPSWSADGRQIYYVSKDRRIMSVPVTTTNGSFDSGTPVPLFAVSLRPALRYRQYCVSRDGTRFLVNRMVGEDSARSITLVQNWSSGLSK